MKKPHMEPDWKQGWRWFSVQANVLAQAVLAAWIFLRDQPLPEWVMYVLWSVLGLGLIGRFVHQEPKKKEE